jgi:hypothetical protein
MTPRDWLQTVLDDEHADEVIKHRQRLRKPMTDYAAKLLAKKLAACPDPNGAADIMIEKGWQSVEPAWVANLQQSLAIATYQQRQPNQPRNIFEASSMLLAELMEADNGTEPHANDRRLEQAVRNLPPPQRQH